MQVVLQNKKSTYFTLDIFLLMLYSGFERHFNEMAYEEQDEAKWYG
ncbi:MAG: hypothetical protein ACLU4N_25155 [Butyricimonas faecihominis]